MSKIKCRINAEGRSTTIYSSPGCEPIGSGVEYRISYFQCLRGISMTKTLYGKIHGRMIELDQDVGAPDGQAVEVQVKFRQKTEKWGDGIRESAGGWAKYPEMDAIMDELYQARKVERRPQTLGE